MLCQLYPGSCTPAGCRTIHMHAAVAKAFQLGYGDEGDLDDEGLACE